MLADAGAEGTRVEDGDASGALNGVEGELDGAGGAGDDLFALGVQAQPRHARDLGGGDQARRWSRGVATKPRSAGAVMRAASPRAKVRDEGSTHWAGWLRSSLTRATRVPFSMAGPRSKWPSVAFPEAPSPTLRVSVVRAVFAGALFEARVADSASVASRVMRVATQRSPPVVPEVVCVPRRGGIRAGRRAAGSGRSRRAGGGGRGAGRSRGAAHALVLGGLVVRGAHGAGAHAGGGLRLVGRGGRSGLGEARGLVGDVDRVGAGRGLGVGGAGVPGVHALAWTVSV